MDNLNNPKKITIKINGQVKTFKDGTLVDSKPAAAAEPEESFDWILPEEDEESERKVPEIKNQNLDFFLSETVGSLRTKRNRLFFYKRI